MHSAGRRHQLRRHLARAGHPIWGDGQHTGGHPAALAAARAAAAGRRQPPSDPATAEGRQAARRDASATGQTDSSSGRDAAVSGSDALPPSLPAAAHGDSSERDLAIEPTSTADGNSSGSEAGSEEDSAQLSTGRQRLALWAVELRLQHPITDEPLHLMLPRQAELARTCPELTIGDGD